MLKKNLWSSSSKRESTPLSGRQFKDQNLRTKRQFSHANRSINNLYSNKNVNIDQIIQSNSKEIFCTVPDLSQRRLIELSKSIIDQPIVNVDQTHQQLDHAKLELLKRLLGNHNLRHLKQSHYQKLINTFGLQITSVKLDQSKTKIINIPVSAANRISTLESSKRFFEHKKQRFHAFRSSSFRQQYKPKKISNKYFLSRPSTSGNKSQRNTTSMNFRPEIDPFECKLKKYKEFLFMVNLSNRIYRNLEIDKYKEQVRYYVGRGNNANLIHSVMKKRHWMKQTKKLSQAQFVWTQIKSIEYFNKQPNRKRKIISKCVDTSHNIHQRLNDQYPQQINKKGTQKHQVVHPLLKIMNQSDCFRYLKLNKKNLNDEFYKRILNFNDGVETQIPQANDLVHNHLPNNGLMGNKKAMFYCLREYYRLTNQNVFSVVPMTFHIRNRIQDQQFDSLQLLYNQNIKNKRPNIWIIKPGEYSNRGNGISCANTLEEIKKKITNVKKVKQTFIVQEYLTRPLLYYNRKFDIRAYLLVTNNNGVLKGYWYQEGYIRTSSTYFDLNELGDPMIHLTNDAVQKNGQDYGKFEEGNKLTYNQLQRYLASIKSNFDFYSMAYPVMKKIATDAVKATCLFLNPDNKLNNFQIFGLDFMIDEDFKVWLIEINTNPCLELSCGVLQRLIPHMIQIAFRIAVDPIFPPPITFPPSRKHNISENALFHNKFELIFDALRDLEQLESLYKDSSIMQQLGMVTEDKEEYTNEGKVIDIFD